MTPCDIWHGSVLRIGRTPFLKLARCRSLPEKLRIYLTTSLISWDSFQVSLPPPYPRLRFDSAVLLALEENGVDLSYYDGEQVVVRPKPDTDMRTREHIGMPDGRIGICELSVRDSML